MDFFTVSTLTGRVLFVLVLLSHDGRRIVHVKVTENSTSAWTAQQLVEVFPEDSAPDGCCEIGTASTTIGCVASRPEQ